MELKRIFDFTGALLSLLLALPVLGIVSLLIRISSPGPVLYRGRRMGKDGREFRILKFRTMVADADRKGPGVTYRGDGRITRVGKFLRDNKLDELPQLFNVLKGEMSLVGPRAEDPKYRKAYEGRYSRLLDVPPGMTGLSWVRLKQYHEESIDPGVDWEKHYTEVSLPRKLEADLDYVLHRSLWLDLKILAWTFIGFLGK